MSYHQRGRGLVTDHIIIASVFACLLVCACQARTLHAQSSSSCSKKLFWFTAITTNSDLEYWRYGTSMQLCSQCCTGKQTSAHPSFYSLRGRLRNPSTHIKEELLQCHRRPRHVHCVAAKVALLSSREKSPNLVPVIIVGGAQGSASNEFLDNLAWFREHGGIVYHHNLTFGADLQVCLDTHSARYILRCTIQSHFRLGIYPCILL